MMIDDAVGRSGSDGLADVIMCPRCRKVRRYGPANRADRAPPPIIECAIGPEDPVERACARLPELPYVRETASLVARGRVAFFGPHEGIAGCVLDEEDFGVIDGRRPERDRGIREFRQSSATGSIPLKRRIGPI